MYWFTKIINENKSVSKKNELLKVIFKKILILL